VRQHTVASVLVLLALAASATPNAHAETTGECGFDSATLAFAGTPLEQATCLLRKVEPLGERRPQALPAVIAGLMAQTTPPSEAMRAAAIAAFPEPYRGFALDYASDPLSQTEAGLPALYFVIHDTSTPFLGDDPFPDDLDHDPEVNSFEPYLAAEPVAHIFLNRAGQIWAGHDFAEPWRATKLESYVIGVPARGRFVHIETVQPRRFIAGYDDLAHTEGPSPGFSDAQYRMLAALYVYASPRAGRWLIPAQHNTVDAGIPDAHDDPQNFDLGKFARALERLIGPPIRPR
jgi:hypothetical protein